MTAKLIGSLGLHPEYHCNASLQFRPIDGWSDKKNVFYSGWTLLARFHMVWLISTNCAFAFTVLCFLLIHRFEAPARIRAVGISGLSVLGSFFLSAMTKGLYGGSLVDLNGGVPPIMGLDANLVVFAPMIAFPIVGDR